MGGVWEWGRTAWYVLCMSAILLSVKQSHSQTFNDLGMRLTLTSLIPRLLYKWVYTWEWNKIFTQWSSPQTVGKARCIECILKTRQPKWSQKHWYLFSLVLECLCHLFVFFTLYRFVGEMFLIENRSFIQFESIYEFFITIYIYIYIFFFFLCKNCTNNMTLEKQ